MKTYAFVLVFLGGGLGSMLRYFFLQFTFYNTIAWHTIIANIFASAILAFVTFYLSNKQFYNTEITLLICVGFCGGLSTFSTFSLDTFQLLTTQQIGLAILTMMLNIGLCLLTIFFVAKIMA